MANSKALALAGKALGHMGQESPAGATVSVIVMPEKARDAHEWVSRLQDT